jgi:two-component system, OmpR family, phosphate regulon sensor histidine kinase PhoR
VRTIQSKITLTFILLSLAVTALLGLLLSVEIENTFFARLTSQLETETQTIESLLSDLSVGTDSREKGERILHSLSSSTKSRVTLIGPDGSVVYDSWIPDSTLAALENHASRPEILKAREHTIGWDKRGSKSTGEELFYVARMVHLEKERSGVFANVQFIRVAISSREVDESVREIRLKTILAGLVVLVIGIIASRFLARQIAKPIVEIGEIIRKIQEGDLDQKLPVQSHDEIGRLSLLINNMTEKLKADIEQLKKLERVRSEFLGNVSHELRTPIFSLKGFLETLLEGAVNDPAVNLKFVQKAYNHANRLDSLLSDLIEISRIESGEMKMSFRYFDLSAFVHQVVQDSADQAAKREQRLEVVTPPHEVPVLGDRDRLKLAAANIIDNAIKYSQAGALIVVRIIEAEHAATLSISDNGPGIEHEHLPRIFERFYRVDKNRSRDVGGTGLGLAIVKHIVEAHGSKIIVTSDVGKGTTFAFDLKK